MKRWPWGTIAVVLLIAMVIKNIAIANASVSGSVIWATLILDGAAVLALGVKIIVWSFTRSKGSRSGDYGIRL